jgi:hypothetical protein
VWLKSKPPRIAVGIDPSSSVTETLADLTSANVNVRHCPTQLARHSVQLGSRGAGVSCDPGALHLILLQVALLGKGKVQLQRVLVLKAAVSSLTRGGRRAAPRDFCLLRTVSGCPRN